MLNVETVEGGDVVYAATTFYNDGSLEGISEDAVMAPAGTRGVIVRKGHLKDQPSRIVFLVRFEDPDKTLGAPIGCWPEELRAEEA